MQDSLEDYIRLMNNTKPATINLTNEEKKVSWERKQQCENYAFKIVEFMIEGKLQPQVFIKSLNFIHPEHYQDIVEERAVVKLCGYPVCGKRLPQMPKKQYHISTKQNKVYDITDRKLFCSNYCYQASEFVQKQIDNSPLWMRRPEDFQRFILLDQKEILRPGVEIDHGLAKLPTADNFTSVNSFAEASLDEAEEMELKRLMKEKEEEEEIAFGKKKPKSILIERHLKSVKEEKIEVIENENGETNKPKSILKKHVSIVENKTTIQEEIQNENDGKNSKMLKGKNGKKIAEELKNEEAVMLEGKNGKKIGELKNYEAVNNVENHEVFEDKNKTKIPEIIEDKSTKKIKEELDNEESEKTPEIFQYKNRKCIPEILEDNNTKKVGEEFENEVEEKIVKKEEIEEDIAVNSVHNLEDIKNISNPEIFQDKNKCEYLKKFREELDNKIDVENSKILDDRVTTKSFKEIREELEQRKVGEHPLSTNNKKTSDQQNIESFESKTINSQSGISTGILNDVSKLEQKLKGNVEMLNNLTIWDTNIEVLKDEIDSEKSLEIISDASVQALQEGGVSGKSVEIISDTNIRVEKEEGDSEKSLEIISDKNIRIEKDGVSEKSVEIISHTNIHVQKEGGHLEKADKIMSDTNIRALKEGENLEKLVDTNLQLGRGLDKLGEIKESKEHNLTKPKKSVNISNEAGLLKSERNTRQINPAQQLKDGKQEVVVIKKKITVVPDYAVPSTSGIKSVRFKLDPLQESSESANTTLNEANNSGGINKTKPSEEELAELAESMTRICRAMRIDLPQQKQAPTITPQVEKPVEIDEARMKRVIEKINAKEASRGRKTQFIETPNNPKGNQWRMKQEIDARLVKKLSNPTLNEKQKIDLGPVENVTNAALNEKQRGTKPIGKVAKTAFKDKQEINLGPVENETNAALNEKQRGTKQKVDVGNVEKVTTAPLNENQEGIKLGSVEKVTNAALNKNQRTTQETLSVPVKKVTNINQMRTTEETLESQLINTVLEENPGRIKQEIDSELNENEGNEKVIKPTLVVKHSKNMDEDSKSRSVKSKNFADSHTLKSTNRDEDNEMPKYVVKIVEKIKPPQKDDADLKRVIEKVKNMSINKSAKVKEEDKLKSILEKIKRKDDTAAKKAPILISTEINPEIEVPKKKEIFKPKEKEINSSLDKIRLCLLQWLTFESYVFIHGEAKIKSVLNEKALDDYFDKLKVAELETAKQVKYMNICKKLQLRELAEEKFDGVLLNTYKQRKPLPDYSRLKEEGKEMDLKVKAFFTGQVYEREDPNFKSAKRKDADEESEESPAVLPLVDAGSQNAVRKKIFINAVSKYIQIHMKELVLEETVLIEVQTMIKTFKLEADNIVFKPQMWNIIGFVLILIMSRKCDLVNDKLANINADTYRELIFSKFDDWKDFLQKVLHIVERVDVYVENYIVSD